MSNYSYNVVHRPGKCISHADALSRLPLPIENRIQHISVADNNLQQFIGVEEIEEEQHKDAVISNIIIWTINGWPKEVEEEGKPYSKMVQNF